MIGHTAQTQTMRAKGWAHPAEGLSIDDLVAEMERLGNPVLEVHRRCSCLGSQMSGLPDDHLLLFNAEVTS